MENLKYLQNVFFLLVMGFSFNIICACSDDEENEPFKEPNKEQTANSSGDSENGGMNPADSIMPPAEEPVLPNDSTSGGENEQFLFSDTIMVDGHGAIDLGLPSGLKWAICNVGDSLPEGYGEHYAWGETEEKSDYFWDTYKWSNSSGNSLTKYCTDDDYGVVDKKTVIEPKDDVAHVKWGSSWRMPTLEEITELVNNCSWKWITYKGINGQLVTGPNGNCIFLPAAGDRTGTSFSARGSFGNYWSATLKELYDNFACYLYFCDDGSVWHYYGGRDDGHSVRPVTDK